MNLNEVTAQLGQLNLANASGPSPDPSAELIDQLEAKNITVPKTKGEWYKTLINKNNGMQNYLPHKRIGGRREPYAIDSLKKSFILNYANAYARLVVLRNDARVPTKKVFESANTLLYICGFLNFRNGAKLARTNKQCAFEFWMHLPEPDSDDELIHPPPEPSLDAEAQRKLNEDLHSLEREALRGEGLPEDASRSSLSVEGGELLKNASVALIKEAHSHLIMPADNSIGHDGLLVALSERFPDLTTFPPKGWPRWNRYTYFDEGVIALAKNCKNLTSLTLDSVYVTDKGMYAFVKHCKLLDTICIYDNWAITMHPFYDLETRKNGTLKKVTCSGTPEMDVTWGGLESGIKEWFLEDVPNCEFHISG